MICREGKISAVSFILSLATQLFGVSEYGEKLALLTSESIFSSIYSLFILYFVVLVLVLSISFKSKDFQVCQGLSVTFSQIVSFALSTDCYTCRDFRIFLRHQFVHHIYLRRSIQVVWNLWSLSHDISLFRVLRHLHFEPSIAVSRLVHVNSFATIWPCRCFKLDGILH